MISLKKVYRVSQKNSEPRLFLQHLVCEAAGFNPGDTLYVHIGEDKREITIQNQPIDEANVVHVSSRINKTSGKRRPLVDTAGNQYRSIISISQKVEVCVYEKQGGTSKIVVRPLRYKLTENASFEPQSDERFRLLSVCAGAGIGTSALSDTGFFSPVMEIEYETDSCEVLHHNFANSMIFSGDLRDCHEVASSDLALVTLPCSEFSSLGDGQEGIFDNLAIATAKILLSSEPKAILFENVPKFYKSQTYQLLKELLLDKFPYWTEANLESYDFGSIHSRNRGYAVAFQDQEAFNMFRFPTPPKAIKRGKLKDYLDHKGTDHEWKELDRWLTSFESKKEKNNAWADRSTEKTFLTPDATYVQCIVKRYRGQSASNSYLLNETGTKWRYFSVAEIERMLGVPGWFQFPEYTPITRIYEMLGQSMDARLVKAMGNQLATVLYKMATKVKTKLNEVGEQVERVIVKTVEKIPLVQNISGQLQMAI